MRRLLVVAAVSLAFPGTAFAHATLRSTTPAFGTELQRAPARIVLRFDQHVKLLPGSVQVLNGVGRNFAAPAHVRGATVVARVRPVRLGAYTVRWQAISADSHVVSGVWTFGVRVPAPAVAAAYGAGGPTATEDVVRWLWFLGLAATIGALGLRVIVLRGLDVPRAIDRKLAVGAGLGALVSLQAGIAAFSLRSEDALQLPFRRFLYGDLSPMAATRFGEAFVAMTLGFALVLALVYLAWLLDRVSLFLPALVLSLVLVGGLSVSGHDAVDAGSWWLTELADWVHSRCRLTLDRRACEPGGARVVRRTGAAPRSVHALLAPRDGAVGLVLVAGTYLGIVRLPHLHDLWTESYGRVLLVKLALVGVALAWGAFHHFVNPAGARPRRREIALADRGQPRRRESRRCRGHARRRRARRLQAAAETDRKRRSGSTAREGNGDTRPVKILAASLLTAVALAPPTAKVDVGEQSYGLASAAGSVWAGGLSLR